jgi:hypothetical protein
MSFNNSPKQLAKPYESSVQKTMGNGKLSFFGEMISLLKYVNREIISKTLKIRKSFQFFCFPHLKVCRFFGQMLKKTSSRLYEKTLIFSSRKIMFFSP